MERYGFRFWLLWILWFAASFLMAAGAWTLALTWIAGSIRGLELAITWSVAVFGSWFVLLIPFMRKKEKIWKRMNTDQESAVTAWLNALSLFLGTLILSAFFWSWFYRVEVTSLHRGVHMPWLKAVLTTWLVAFLPFLVWMYKKADQIYKSALARQMAAGPSFRTEFIERSKRTLPPELAQKIKKIRPTLNKGHVLNLTLKDGRSVRYAFVLNDAEILGVYDRPRFDFNANEVAEIEAVNADAMPVFEESKWLRLDGRA